MGMQQPMYVYVLEIPGLLPAVFTWPNALRKYLRDVYTVNGQLCMPPAGVIKCTRYKVNPKAGGAIVADNVDLQALMAFNGRG